MDFDELVDRYRSLKMKYRIIAVLIVGMLPALYYWLEEGDNLTNTLLSLDQEMQEKKQTVDTLKGKAAQLPAFKSQINAITGELEKAKKFLPDVIEMDLILAQLGQYEKETGVQIVKFQPLPEVSVSNGLTYSQVPVQLNLKSTFTNIMIFFDKILHMKALTHLRSIEFKTAPVQGVVGDDNNDGQIRSEDAVIESQSQLILYKGI